jgi:hypothetical protein
MPQYSSTVNATSNSSANTEDTFQELSAANVKIKKIVVRLGDGTGTAGVDNDWRVRIVRKTAGGATGTSGTSVRNDQVDRTSAATNTIKNGTSAFTTATLGDIVDAQVKNGRETYLFIARDQYDYIGVHPTLGSGGMFAILIKSAVASQTFQVTTFWEE